MKPNRPIRVAVVDDLPLVRGGLVMMLGSQPDLAVLVSAANGAEALTALATTRVDVVLMDIRMPVLDGIEATRLLLDRDAAGPRVIVLTTFALDEYVLSALRVGASGFLLKDTRPRELFEAVRSVHRGDAVIAPAMTRRLLDHVAPLLAEPSLTSRRAFERLARLTPREHDVFALIATARSNAEIALHLHLSEATVKTHVAHVLAKLGVRDRVQAVVLAYEAGVAHGGAERASGTGGA